MHAHDAWQRHRHGGDDAGLITLDAPGDGQGSTGSGALLLSPVLGSPQRGLRIDAGAAALTRGWPRPGGARFSSWGRAPPLQPPRRWARQPKNRPAQVLRGSNAPQDMRAGPRPGRMDFVLPLPPGRVTTSSCWAQR